MSFQVSPQALRFADADSELAEFEIKQGLMKWVASKLNTTKGLMEYANMVCAAGDSLFGDADANVVDFAHHVMESFDSSCWTSTKISVVGDYLVVAPASVDLYLYERDIRETVMGAGESFDCSVKNRSQCPVCLWHTQVRKHCSVCWSRNGNVRLALLSVDFPFYIHEDMVEFIRTLGLGKVSRSVDGITRWWVKLDVATYVKVQDGLSVNDVLGRMAARRAGLFGVALDLMEGGRVSLTTSPSVSALTALVRAEGERVGPLVFALAMAKHLGADGVCTVRQGHYSVLAGSVEDEQRTSSSNGARIESLSLLAQLQLTSGTSHSLPVLPSRCDKFLTAGYFSGMDLCATSRYMHAMGLILTANMRELSITIEGEGRKVRASKTKRRSVQGLSPLTAQLVEKLHAESRGTSPLSDVSADSWSNHVSPTSSVTTVNSLPGFADTFALDSVVVTPYVSPYVGDEDESGAEHTYLDVDGDREKMMVVGHVLSEEEGVTLISRKAVHEKLFDYIKNCSAAADYVEQTNIRPWYDGTVRQGEGDGRMMPYIHDIYTEVTPSEQGASMAVAHLKSKIQSTCLNGVSHYVSMGAVVDVILKTTRTDINDIDMDTDMVVVVSVRAPSVDPLTRESFEVACETYRLNSGVFAFSPDIEHVSVAHRAELFTGWLLCRYVPAILTHKRPLKLRTIDINQFMNNGQLQVQCGVSGGMIDFMVTLMKQGLNLEAGAALVWFLNIQTNKSYKFIWKDMYQVFERLELGMVTTRDVDKSGYAIDMTYIDGEYETVYDDYTLSSEKSSVLLRAVRGMAMAKERGDTCFEHYVASLDAEKQVNVERSLTQVDDEMEGDL